MRPYLKQHNGTHWHYAYVGPTRLYAFQQCDKHSDRQRRSLVARHWNAEKLLIIIKHFKNNFSSAG